MVSSVPGMKSKAVLFKLQDVRQRIFVEPWRLLTIVDFFFIHFASCCDWLRPTRGFADAASILLLQLDGDALQVTLKAYIWFDVPIDAARESNEINLKPENGVFFCWKLTFSSRSSCVTGISSSPSQCADLEFVSLCLVVWIFDEFLNFWCVLFCVFFESLFWVFLKKGCNGFASCTPWASAFLGCCNSHGSGSASWSAPWAPAALLLPSDKPRMSIGRQISHLLAWILYQFHINFISICHFMSLQNWGNSNLNLPLKEWRRQRRLEDQIEEWGVHNIIFFDMADICWYALICRILWIYSIYIQCIHETSKHRNIVSHSSKISGVEPHPTALCRCQAFGSISTVTGNLGPARHD